MKQLNCAWAALETRRKKKPRPCEDPVPSSATCWCGLWFLETKLIFLPGMYWSEWAYGLPCSLLFWGFFLFICLGFLCGVVFGFVLFWISFCRCSCWGDLIPHSCKGITEECILMGSITSISVHMSLYLWKGCFFLLPWLDTVYCPAEDGPGGADFHLCKICPCCSLQ